MCLFVAETDKHIQLIEIQLLKRWKKIRNVDVLKEEDK